MRCLFIATVFIAVPVSADDGVETAFALSAAIDARALENAVAEGSATTSFDGYLPPPLTRDELNEKHRIRGPRIALVTSAATFIGGLTMELVATAQCEEDPYESILWCDPLPWAFSWTGTALWSASAVAMLTSGIILGVRRGKRRRDARMRSGGERRVMTWDSSVSGLRF